MHEEWIQNLPMVHPPDEILWIKKHGRCARWYPRPKNASVTPGDDMSMHAFTPNVNLEILVTSYVGKDISDGHESGRVCDFFIWRFQTWTR